MEQTKGKFYLFVETLIKQNVYISAFAKIGETTHCLARDITY